MTVSRSDELAALMCSKICHDLISPIGALGNGIEVLEDEDDEEMRQTALDLIAGSVRTASDKLQFARLAFGLAGGPGGSLDLAEAARAAQGYFAHTKAKLNWSPNVEARPKDDVRLMLNLLLVGLMGIPRGGEIAAEMSNEPFSARISVTGKSAGLNEQIRAALDGNADLDELDARMIQPFYAGLIARRLGTQIEIQEGEDTLNLYARLAA